MSIKTSQFFGSPKKICEENETLLDKITTIHGTNYFHSKSDKNLVLWSLAMIMNVVLTTIFIIVIKQKFRNDQIYTKINANCQVSQVPFPAVSICNFNMVSLKETANIARILRNHNRTEKEINKFFEDLPKLKDYSTADADSAVAIMDILKKHYYTMDTIMEEVLQKCENLLLYCTFNRKVKNCVDIFNLIKTVEGHCCAFNYAALNDVAENPLLPHDETMEYYDGEEAGDEVLGPIIATSESGRTSGLTVVFNVEPEDYPSWSTVTNYGATVLISDPNDFPETSVQNKYVTTAYNTSHCSAQASSHNERAWAVVPTWAQCGLGTSHIPLNCFAGTSVDIKVEPKVYQSESDLKHVAPSRRACWFHDEVALEHTDRYSYETCVTECTMNNFIQFCGCTPYKYPRDGSRRFCELADLPCMHNLTVYGKGVPCDPPCYVECRDKGYSIAENTVPFLVDDFPSNVTSGRPLNSIASIKVYFRKSTCNCYKLTLLMDVNYFIATYGGVLSLSFGASLLTIVELFYLFISYLVDKFFKYFKCYQ